MRVIYRDSQSGSALIISLILLVLLTIIGVSAMQNTTMQEIMSGNIKDQHRSFHAAELGLRQAEQAATGTVICGNNFADNFFNAANPAFTNIAPGGDELPSRYRSAFCGPQTREVVYDEYTATSDRGGQSRLMMQYYTAVSVGEVPGNAQTNLVSTVAKQL